MSGTIYRLGVWLKDRGESLGCAAIIRLGLAIRDKART
jgi:hypothetical protein